MKKLSLAYDERIEKDIDFIHRCYIEHYGKHVGIRVSKAEAIRIAIQNYARELEAINNKKTDL